MTCDLSFTRQVMKDGRIKQAGRYNDILRPGSDFMELIGAHEEALSSLDSISTEKSANGEGSSSTNAKPVLQQPESEKHGNDNNNEETKGQLFQEEERVKGSVGLSVYWNYITTAYGGLLAPVALLAQIVFQVLQIGSNYWMALATPVSEDEAPLVGSSTLILVYVALSIGSAYCILGRALSDVTISYKTAKILFNRMHLCIFRAPMSFFDSTPSGRILNRVCDNALFFSFVFILAYDIWFLSLSLRLTEILLEVKLLTISNPFLSIICHTKK